MKLHLPSGLRAALFACFAAFAGIGTTLTTATITGGVFAVTIAGQAAYAVDYEGSLFDSTAQIGYKTGDGDTTKKLGDGVSLDDTVTYNGISGWLPLLNNGAVTYNANIKVEGEGLTINDGSSNRTYIFPGTLSGTGQFAVTKNISMTFQFEGDLSGHTGAFKTTVATPTIILKNGTADTTRTIGSSSVEVVGTLRIEGAGSYAITNAATAGTLAVKTAATFNGSLTATTVNVTDNGALTVNAASSITNLTVADGSSLTIGDDGVLALNGTITGLVGSVNNGVVTFGDNAVVTLSDSAFTQQEDGSYTLALFSADGTGTMSGLTVDKLDGVVTAGRDWNFGENGTISYTITCQDLSYAGGTLAWNAGATMQGGNGQFADGDMVTFTGETEATLGAPINSALVTVENGATLSLTNGGVAENTLMTESLIVNGTLTLKDAALAAGTRVTAESTGTVVIDAAADANIDVQAQLADFTGTLDVQSGRYVLNTAKATPFSSLNVKEGGQLDLMTSYAGAMSLEGHGTGGDWRDTALRLSGGNTISGKVTIEDAGSSIAVNSGNATISGELAGTGDFKKTEGGRLYLTGNITNTGTLDIQGGSVSIGAGPGHTNSMSFSNINVGANCTLQFQHGGANFSGTDVTLNSGTTLHMEDSNCGNTVPIPDPESKAIALGKLTLTGDAKISWNWKGAFSFTELTGAGNLALEGDVKGNDPRAVIISAMNNYSGTITGTPAKHVLYLGSVHQDAGLTATITGVVGDSSSLHLTDFSKTGAGDLVITDSVTVSGILTMNYEGGLYHGLVEGTSDVDTTKTGLTISSVADGTVLAYTTAEGLLSLTSTAVGESTKLTLDLGAVLINGTPADGINLGISADVAKENLIVGATATGGQLVQKDGTWWYTGGSFHTDWDLNWGSAELATAPSSVVSVDDYSGTRSLGDYTTPDSDPAVKPYRNDSTTSILIAGTSADNGELIGGESSDISSTGRTVELDSWIKMTGGNLHLIVGGNYCNNWGSGGAVNFKGDSHILIESAGEGEAAAPVVDYIIGGNYEDGKEPLFTGNSYISIKSDSLQGGIIGGSTVAHSSATTFRGDSNISIYTPQTLEADSALINLSAENGNVIVGGNAKLTNVNGTLNFDGNTNIILDFADFTATNATATMGKGIIGGSYTYSSSGNAVTGVTHTGDTNITIRNADTTTFSKDIIGGSMMNAQTITQAGTARIDISSGIYTGNIIGGHYSTAGGATFSLGAVDVNLSGGTFKADIYAAGYLANANSTMTTGSTTVTIGSAVTLGAADAAITVGGGYNSAGTGGTVTGDRVLNIAGTHANANFQDFDTIVIGSSVTMGGLTLGEGATLQLDMTGAVAQGAAMLNVSGALTLGDKVNLELSGVEGLAVNNSYTLLEWTGDGVTLDKFACDLSAYGSDSAEYVLAVEGNKLVLNIGTIMEYWNWTDADGGTWGDASSWGQTDGSPDGKTLTFGDGVFSDAATTNTVTIAGQVAPAAVVVTPGAGHTYEFTGDGGIASGTLEMNGAGTLVLATTNASADTLTITQGTLQLGKDDKGASWAGSVVNKGALTVTANSSVGSYDATSTGTISVADGKTLTVGSTSKDMSLGEMLSLLAAGDASQAGMGGTIAVTNAGSDWSKTPLSGAHELTGTVDIKGKYTFNKGVNFKPDSALSLSVKESGSLDLSGVELVLYKNTNLGIDGGSLKAGAIYYGGGAGATLSMSSGSITAASIKLEKADGATEDATFSMTGGTLTLGSSLEGSAKSVSITGGTLKTSDADGWELKPAVTLGAVTIADKQADGTTAAGTITFSGDATVTDTIINNGKLVLSGQIALADSALADLTSEGGQILSGSNGFAQTKYYVVDGRGSEDSSLTASDTEMTVGSETYTLTVDNGSLTFLTSGNSGLYYVNTGSVTYGGADSDMPVANVTGLVLNGGALVLASGLDAAATEGITLKQNSTITLDGTGVQLNGSGVTCEGDSKLTLAGNGTYVASEVASLEKLASLAASTTWTGIIDTYVGTANTGSLVLDSSIDLNDLGNANSTVLLEGVTGHMKGGTIATNIKLANTNWAGLDLTGVDADVDYTFTGKISGSGNLNVASGNTADVSLTFSGDVSEWTGALGANKATEVTFNGANQTIKVNVNGSANVTYAGTGTTTVNASGSYSGTTTISTGTVTLASGVTGFGSGTEIAAGATLHLQGNTLTNAITNAGTLLVSGASSISSLAGGALELSSALTVTGAASGLTSLTVTTTPLAELCAGGALVSAGSVALADELTVNVGGALLSTSEVGEYTLLSSGAAMTTADKKLTLAVGSGDKVTDNGDGTFTVGQIKYTLGFNADADAIVLTGAVMDSDEWTDNQGDSVWAPTTSDGFAGEQPDSGDLVSFTGSDTVTIDASGAPIEVAGVRVETDNADGYTFTGNAGDGSDTIVSESVAVVKGELTLDNVKVETGEVTVGSSSTSAGLTVGEGSELVASEMQVNAGTDASGLVVEAGAKVEVAGALKSATDANITIGGDLTMGTLSSVDTLTVEGDAATVTVQTGNVTIGAVDGTGTLASLRLGPSADVTVGSDLTVQVLNAKGASVLELSGTNAAGETEYHDLVIESASTAGSVVADNVTLSGEGDYSFTSLDAQGAVTGSDSSETNLALAGESSMASLTDVNKLTITGDASVVTVGSDVTLDELAGTGAIELSTTDATNGSTTYHNLVIESASSAGSVVAGDVSLNGAGDYSFSSIEAQGAVTGNGEGLELAGTSSMDSLTGVGTLTITGDASVVTVGSDVTTNLASNAGTLDVGDYTLTLTEATTDGGNVSAGTLDISGVTGMTTVDSLTTDSIVLDVSGLTLGTDALLHVDGALTQLTQVSTFALDATGGVQIELTGIPTGTVDGIDAPTAEAATAAREWAKSLGMGDYTLISYGSLVGGLTLATPSLDNVQQLFALDGVDAWFTEVTNGGTTSVVMHLAQASDREWSSNNATWAGKPGEATLGIDLSTGRPTLAVATYDMFNTVSKVTMAGDYEIDLSGSDMTTNTDASLGLIIRDLDGAGTLTLTGAGYQDDLATIDNTAERTLAGNLVANNITLNVQGEKMTVTDLVSDEDAWVHVKGSMAVSGDATATNQGWITVEDGATLDVAGLTTASADGCVQVEAGGSMTAADILLDGGELYVATGGELTADSLTLEGEKAKVIAAGVVLAGAINGTEGTISGSIGLVDGWAASAGSYSGKYEDAVVVLGDGVKQDLAIGGESGSDTLALAAGKGAASTLSYSGNATLLALYTDGADITLNRTGAGTLTAGNDSAMVGGSLSYTVDAQDVIDGTVGAVTSGIDLVGTRVHVNAGDATSGMTFDVENGTTGWTLFSHEGADSLTLADISLEGKFFDRYFENVTVENGEVKADLVTDYYTEALGATENGKTGLQMLDMAELQANPQDGDLKDVLDSLKGYMGTADKAAADKLASAVAGSGLASVGMALAGDVERQLKAIRNRTTTMGVDPSVVNEGMPYFNAWINAEGDHRSMDQDSTLAGYRLTSWGGTVGFDMDVEPTLTWGLALTAMYGDFNAESADVVEGDMDTYYVSAFARKTSGAWVHTFVATAGLSRTDLSRTVSHSGGSYTTQGEADGMSFGFLYEVARTFALNEDATACWQPVFNVAYRHTSVDGYDEKGSDAALTVGDQTLNTVTFGLGGRLQAVVGENIYNRTSVFEGRALVKFDAGDLQSEMDTALIGASAATGSVKSAEMDAFGIELGAGLSIPVGMESGTIFLDGAVEFRGCYTSANGTVGYRVNF